MFIRQCYRRKSGKRHAYWALVESYRTSRGSRQRIVSYLGDMEEQGRLGIRQTATGQGTSCQQRLFDNVSPRWVLPTKLGTEIRRRCICRPTDHQAILLHHWGLAMPTNLPVTEKILKVM